MTEKPEVSVIIPIAPDGECDVSLESIRRQNYDKSKIQTLVAVGRHRSRQRNAALKRATGEIIWFMDNDVTIVDPEYLNRQARHYADEKVASAGGPSLTPETDSFFQRTVGRTLGSYFATMAARARYMSLGAVRDTDEKELILCSQTFRASALEDGFDPRLHSGNEENELMNRIVRAGYRMIYDPDLIVYRSQRANLLEFMKQMGKYGKSRIEHFLIRPSAFETMFLIPLFFFLYLISLPALLFLHAPVSWKLIALAPLLLYAIGSLAAAAQTAVRARDFRMFLSSLPMFAVVHVGYALGNLLGMIRRIVPEKREVPEVIVREITL